MMGQSGAPEGASSGYRGSDGKLFVRRRGGKPRFIGRQSKPGADLMVYVHSDGGELHPLPLDALLDARDVLIRQMIAAAALDLGQSEDDVRAFFAEEARRRLASRTGRAPSLLSSGSVCPDRDERTAPDGSHSGPGPCTH